MTTLLVAFRPQPTSWSSKNPPVEKNPEQPKHGFTSASCFNPLESVKDLANKFYIVGRTTGCLRESFCQWCIFALPLALREGFVDGDSLVQGPHGDPESSFQRVRVRVRKVLGRKAMANLAVELDEFALSGLIKRPVALGQTNDTASSRNPGFFVWLMSGFLPFSFALFSEFFILERVSLINRDGIFASGRQ